MTKRTLLTDLKVGQSLSVDGGRIVITLEEKSGQRAKLRIVHDGATVDRAPIQAEPARRRVRNGAGLAMLGTKAA